MNDKPDPVAEKAIATAVTDALLAYQSQAPRFSVEVGAYGAPTHAPRILIQINGGSPEAMEAFGLELTKLIAERIPALHAKKDA